MHLTTKLLGPSCVIVSCNYLITVPHVIAHNWRAAALWRFYLRRSQVNKWTIIVLAYQSFFQGKPVLSFDPEGLVFSVGVQSEQVESQFSCSVTTE